jgi:hypothetical protein
MHQEMYPDRIAAEIDLYHGTHINAPSFVKVAESIDGYGEQVTDPEKPGRAEARPRSQPKRQAGDHRRDRCIDDTEWAVADGSNRPSRALLGTGIQNRPARKFFERLVNLGLGVPEVAR